MATKKKAKATKATKAKKAQPDGGLDLAVMRDELEREETGVVVPLLRRDGSPALYDGEPVTVTVRGEQSPSYRRAHERFAREFYRDRLEGVTSDEERDAVIAASRDEWEREYDREVRAPNIIAWHGLLDGGEPAELTLERAQQLLMVPHLRARIVRGQSSPQDFFGADSGG